MAQPPEEPYKLQLLCNEEIAPAIDSTLGRPNLKRVRISSIYVENVELAEGRKFLDELLKIAKRDVEVTILIGKKPNKDHWRRFFQELQSFGINLYYNSKVHSKLILINSADSNIAFIGSSNFTHGGLRFRFEVGVFFTDFPKEKFNKLETYYSSVVGSDETRVLKDVV